MYKLRIVPNNIILDVVPNTNLMKVLHDSGIFVDAPCGRQGKCGKCKVVLDREDVLACQITVDRDMTVTLPQKKSINVLHTGIIGDQVFNPVKDGYLVAFDIGTTSVVCFLLDGITGSIQAKSSMLNPQNSFGADVISRIQAAIQGEMSSLTSIIREGMTLLVQNVCQKAQISPEEIGVVSVVGNPAMQQLFLGMSPKNLAGVPFAPVLTEAKTISCKDVLPICPNATLLIVPDISGYIGADAIGCILASEIYKAPEITLLVDIGTNGEMVLGNSERMIACSTAAGPALEGANIQFGMRGSEGAIDHVWLNNSEVQCSVIGGGCAKGICGSGIVDAIAVGLELGILNKRGRIQNKDRVFFLTDGIYLSQEDIRQVQLAKGAICSGVSLMAKHLGIELKDIQKVQLAGAFGYFLNPHSACRIGLLPEELLDKIESIGNAASSGARMLACNQNLLPLTQKLTRRIEFLELASMPEFSKTFAKAMNFREVIK